eukprot:1431199-Prymnesium_polylepis.1
MCPPQAHQPITRPRGCRQVCDALKTLFVVYRSWTRFKVDAVLSVGRDDLRRREMHARIPFPLKLPLLGEQRAVCVNPLVVYVNAVP